MEGAIVGARRRARIDLKPTAIPTSPLRIDAEDLAGSARFRTTRQIGLGPQPCSALWLLRIPAECYQALGGTGKTAVVFEFCLRLISDPPAWLSKVVWLTAKKQAFSAIQGQYVSVTRTDFESPDGFLATLAQELGAMDEEIKEADDREGLLDLVLKGLRMFPSLVVLDDIDSLVLEEQADLFSTVQTVAGRSFDQGSRFILSQRCPRSCVAIGQQLTSA